jgi:cyanophycinase-like exopeptidase
MILVREFFIAKPGQAGKLAAMIKDVMSDAKDDVRIMTDITGEFNKVVMETTVADFAAFEARMKEYGSKPEMREKMKGYTELWITGGREIYRLVD